MEKHPVISRIDLEPLGGIAGDMFASAMYSGFPWLYTEFKNDLATLGVDGLTVNLEQRLSNGLDANYFSVEQRTTLNPPRTLTAVKQFIQESNLDEAVSNHVVGLFTELARAESEVHGKSVDTVHFHEVSDWDSVIDIVAAAGVIARLKCNDWRVGVLPLGSGTVKTAHGDIPLPAPATLALLKNFQWHDDGIGGERVTPTGAAILSYLKALPVGVATDAARLVAVGSGCGSRTLVGRANILRMMAFSANGQPSSLLEDKVFRVAFEVDDMTAEEIAWAADKLRSVEGVVDVSCLTMQGKKNRSTTGIRMLTTSECLQDVVGQSFILTSTIGIRYSCVDRFVLRRTEQAVENAAMEIASVKIVDRPQGLFSAKAASDDLASAASLIERRRLALEVCEKAMQVRSDENPEGNH